MLRKEKGGPEGKEGGEEGAEVGSEIPKHEAKLTCKITLHITKQNLFNQAAKCYAKGTKMLGLKMQRNQS